MIQRTVYNVKYENRGYRDGEPFDILQLGDFEHQLPRSLIHGR